MGGVYKISKKDIQDVNLLCRMNLYKTNFHRYAVHMLKLVLTYYLRSVVLSVLSLYSVETLEKMTRLSLVIHIHWWV